MTPSTEDFIDSLEPGELDNALSPVRPIVQGGACAPHDPRIFDESEESDADYAQARAICTICPVLEGCAQTARFIDGAIVLAGQTSQERIRQRTKSERIKLRRMRAQCLRDLGARTVVIAELLGCDPTTIRSDLKGPPSLESNRAASPASSGPE